MMGDSIGHHITLVVWHVAECGVIVALFLPPYYSQLITRMIKIIYIGEGGRETFGPGGTTGRTHAKRGHGT